MHSEEIERILTEVSRGACSVEDALLLLKKEPFTDLGYAKVDHHRALRQNAAEVVYGAGKTPEQIAGIVSSLQNGGEKTVLITRLKPEAAAFLRTSIPLDYHELSEVGIVGSMPQPTGNGRIVIACAGTSDLPVAEEAALTAEVLGNEVVRLFASSFACAHGRHNERAGDCCYCRHGGCACKRYWRHGFMPSHRSAYQCGIRCFVQWSCGIAFNAEFLCEWCECSKHR